MQRVAPKGWEQPVKRKTKTCMWRLCMLPMEPENSHHLGCFMNVYYIFLEGRPLPNNEESDEYAGAYINCWVNSNDEASAKEKALKYIHDEEGWQVLNIEDIQLVNCERYAEEPDSLACFNKAVDGGIGAAFFTWPISCEDN